MTKSTWRNIYNFGSESVSENSFDINDIASSVSETTNSERIARQNIDKLINISGGSIKEDEEVPLVWELNEQSGGNVDADEYVSTEQLENKLRDIFTGLDENVAVTQQGGDCEHDEFGNPIPHMKGCNNESEGAPIMEGGNDETIPLLLSKLLEETGTNKIAMPEMPRDSSDSPLNNVNEDVVTSDIDETLTLSEATYYSDAATLSSILN